MSRPYRGVFLTTTGAALAARVRARHRTVVDLLVAVGVPQETAELDAEGLEHHVSEVTLHAFEAFLALRDWAGRRKPDGRPSRRRGRCRSPRDAPEGARRRRFRRCLEEWYRLPGSNGGPPRSTIWCSNQLS